MQIYKKIKYYFNLKEKIIILHFLKIAKVNKPWKKRPKY